MPTLLIQYHTRSYTGYERRKYYARSQCYGNVAAFVIPLINFGFGLMYRSSHVTFLGVSVHAKLNTKCMRKW